MKKKRSKGSLSALITLELFGGVGLSIVSFISFLVLANNIETLQQLDIYLSHLAYSFRTPELNSVMVFITLLGNEIMLFLLVSVFLILLIYKKRREAIFFLILFAVSVLANLVLKELFARARPEISPLLHEALYSFPSGHAMNSFVFYTALALYVYRFSRRIALSICVGFVCLCLVVLIGISRVYLGVHYVTDVIAGYIAGLCWIATAFAIEKSLVFFQVLRKKTA